MTRRILHCVLQFDQVIGDFLIEGIFSKPDEAEILAKEIEPNWRRTKNSPIGTGPYIVQWDYRQIQHHFMGEIFEKLSDPLRKLVGMSSEFPTNENQNAS